MDQPLWYKQLSLTFSSFLVQHSNFASKAFSSGEQALALQVEEPWADSVPSIFPCQLVEEAASVESQEVGEPIFLS
jgi:hypothetical protein